jgi:hypothetical protein
MKIWKSIPEILACCERFWRDANANANANDFSVSPHETNSLPGNKMYVVGLKKFSLQNTLDSRFEDAQCHQNHAISTTLNNAISGMNFLRQGAEWWCSPFSAGIPK